MSGGGTVFSSSPFATTSRLCPLPGAPRKELVQSLGERDKIGTPPPQKSPFCLCGGSLWRSVMVRFTKAAGSGLKMVPPLFLCFFVTGVLYLQMYLRANLISRCNAEAVG